MESNKYNSTQFTSNAFLQNVSRNFYSSNFVSQSYLDQSGDKRQASTWKVHDYLKTQAVHVSRQTQGINNNRSQIEDSTMTTLPKILLSNQKLLEQKLFKTEGKPIVQVESRVNSLPKTHIKITLKNKQKGTSY